MIDLAFLPVPLPAADGTGIFLIFKINVMSFLEFLTRDGKLVTCLGITLILVGFVLVEELLKRRQGCSGLFFSLLLIIAGIVVLCNVHC